ncbi:MAG: hypothetical protein EOP61_23030 [Sphingomonadales bacterium]|nr:MAG: hypothetical protein EOP61_23030 [Sphingomonadales bacterium]
MSSSVELGSLGGDAAKPFFHAKADGIAFMIELDSSALQKLAGARVGSDWRDAVEAQRGKIRAAAEYLIEGGFLTREAPPRLFLTAMDIV